MHSRPVYIVLLLLAMAVMAMGIGLYFSSQNAPPVTPPVFSPPSQPSPTAKVDKPAYTAEDVIAFARQQSEIQALYAAAEKTKDYKYPEVNDFNWMAEYKGDSRWLITFTFTQWDYNISGYVARARYWYFDESGPKLTVAN